MAKKQAKSKTAGMPPVDHVVRVALVMENWATGQAGPAGIWRGISQFAKFKRNWVIHSAFMPPSGTLETLKDWQPHAIISDLRTPRTRQFIQKLKCPVVQIVQNDPSSRYVIGVNSFAIGQMVGQHFYDRGIRHFAYLGSPGDPYGTQHIAGLNQVAATFNGQCLVLDTAKLPKRGPHTSFEPTDRMVGQWLAALPRPSGVMIPDDGLGPWAMQPRAYADYRVPDDVAIVGVFNNSGVCEITEPPLSSVVLPLEKMGYEAARLVERILDGLTEPVRMIFDPLKVEIRRSSDVLAIADPDVREAVRFIRAGSHRPMRVNDVVKHVLISRSGLEKKFRGTLGRTPLEEIQRVHLERARELLTETDLSLPEVAERSGLLNAFHLCRVIKRETGMTPAKFRKNMRNHTI